MAGTKTEKFVVSKKVSTLKEKGWDHSMKVLKTDGSKVAADNKVKELQKQGVSYFEVADENSKTKTIYSNKMGGKNYNQKVVKL